MSTDVTDSAQPIFLEPEACGLLRDVLQPWLLKMTSLTLVLLAGDGVSICENTSLNELRTTFDEIEQMVRTRVRRADIVVRCSLSCCALVLLDTGVEGARCVINRLGAGLKTSTTQRYSLRLGVAAAPDFATEPEALIAQACTCSTSLVLLEEFGNAIWNVTPRVEWPGAPFTQKVSRRSSGAIRRLNPTLAASAQPEHTVTLRPSAHELGASRPVATLVQTRALALGVPYLAPPESIPASVRNLLPPEVMEQLHCLPVGRERNVLTVALADPTDGGVLRQLEQITGMTIFPVMTDPDVLAELARPARSRRISHLSPAPASRSGR